jgi:hypothetical protein
MPQGSETAIRSSSKKIYPFALDEALDSGYSLPLVSLEFLGIFVDP